MEGMILAWSKDFKLSIQQILIASSCSELSLEIQLEQWVICYGSWNPTKMKNCSQILSWLSNELNLKPSLSDSYMGVLTLWDLMSTEDRKVHITDPGFILEGHPSRSNNQDFHCSGNLASWGHIFI